MKERLDIIKTQTLDKIDKAIDFQGLEKIRVDVLGKKGELTQILKGMGKLSKEERPVVGQLANEVRETITEKLNEKNESLKWEKLRKQIIEESLDVTASKKIIDMGHRHPLNQTMEQLEDLFRHMGFSVIDGPEIETVANNFDK